MGKIVSNKELGRIIEALKKKGRKVVFTNGCFDIIHKGHVRHLREARLLGDALVIGLNSDSSVSSIKPGRPIMPEDERAEVLAALEMVDYVTVFSEDTPYELIKLLKPDILVKGGDWGLKDIVGSDIAPVTKRMPFVEGSSTTSIIKKIQSMKPE